MVRERCCCVEGEEEEVLYDDRGTGEEGRCEGGVLFEAGPGQVDVEEEEKDAEAND